MVDALESAGQASGPGDVLVVGHAMYLSLLALQVLQAVAAELGADLAADGERAIMDANVGEVLPLPSMTHVRNRQTHDRHEHYKTLFYSIMTNIETLKNLVKICIFWQNLPDFC